MPGLQGIDPGGVRAFEIGREKMNKLKKLIKENIEENGHKRCLLIKPYTRGRKYCLSLYEMECGYQSMVMETIEGKKYYRCRL
jgi:hypothetical protein